LGNERLLGEVGADQRMELAEERGEASIGAESADDPRGRWRDEPATARERDAETDGRIRFDEASAGEEVRDHAAADHNRGDTGEAGNGDAVEGDVDKGLAEDRRWQPGIREHAVDTVDRVRRIR